MISSINNLKVSNSYAELPTQFYSQVNPYPLTNPRLLHVNNLLAAELGLSDAALKQPEFLDICSGALPLPGGKTIAAVYSGHQFGVWAGQLGDGRAHLLGEIATSNGPVELQLKGSGKTPYSRMGDGRAVLRSSVREYLVSEAMWGLGIPTTRALALVGSNDPVYRETVETAAIVTRTSPSFIRFGTFEHFANSIDNLTVLLEYTVTRFYPDCIVMHEGKPDWQASTLCFLEQVTKRTAQLIANWITVGFCHGVMNTDNMSVLGLTIDYGPFGFMDAFQANHICNTTDQGGRYAWNAQASAAYWNLHRLAGSFAGMGISEQDLKQSVQGFEAIFIRHYQQNMAAKLGLKSDGSITQLIDGWWRLLHENRADFTMSFRQLAYAIADPATFLANFNDQKAAQNWLDAYTKQVLSDNMPEQSRIKSMNQTNPIYILRNHIAQQAVEEVKQGNLAYLDTLLELLRSPYTLRSGFEEFSNPPPAGMVSVALSCSS